jgi:predicted PurR-regulated permease PerM
VLIATLYFARVVFVPLALALLVSLLLTPVVVFLEGLKFPRIIAIFLVVIAVAGAMGATGWVISQQIVSLTEQLPTYKKTLEEKVHALGRGHSKGLKAASDTLRDLGKEIATTVPGAQSPSDGKESRAVPGSNPSHPLAVEVVAPANPVASVENVLGPLATVGLVVLFTLFMLFGREDLRNRFIRLVGGARLNVMTQALDEATHRINRYLLLQLLVNSGYGLVIATALHFIGIPNAFLWGLSATILRFLPYVGPPLAALIPIGLSLAVFPGWYHALATVGLFVALELLVANFLEPLLYGAHVGLSAFAILVAAVFWTLIWGFPGLILSTPLTVCLVVLGRYVPRVSFLSVLLGDEPVLSPQEQYYQRLLAADSVEARQILDRYLKEKSLEDLYTSVVIPALGLAEQDRHRNELDEETTDFICQSAREMVEELGENSPVSVGDEKEETVRDFQTKSEVDNHIDILCIPARDEPDDIIALMLAQLLERQGQRARSIQIGSSTDMLAEVVEVNPRLVCISALPPFAIDHARALYLKLHAQAPKLNIVTCLWHFEGETEKAAIRLRLAAGHRLFTTLPQVLKFIALEPEKSGTGVPFH